jgi:hypothetical protein
MQSLGLTDPFERKPGLIDGEGALYSALLPSELDAP